MQTDSWAHQGVHPHKDSFTFFSSLYDRAVCVRKNYYGSKIRHSRKFSGRSPEVRRKFAKSKIRQNFTFRFGFENANASNPLLFLPHPPEHPSLQQLVITKINIKYLNKKFIKFMFFHEFKIFLSYGTAGYFAWWETERSEGNQKGIAPPANEYFYITY